MALIKSISGIRGTIGGQPGNNLTPIDIVKFTTAYASFIQSRNNSKCKIVVGRDARLSGKIVENIVVATLMAKGMDVLNIGLATTPTTEMAVTNEAAQGGIIITASHNPKQWNALKLLNEKGEFLNAEEGNQILELAEKTDVEFSEIDAIGLETVLKNYHTKHIEQILDLDLVDISAIKKANFKVVIDAVNSVGGIAVPALLKRLGVEVIELNTEPNGRFPHNPEPLPEHLTELSNTVVKSKSHLGFVVDPDVDRLAIVNEDGSMFGEEYTLVAVADYILSKKSGNTVSNLSSTRALREVTEKYGFSYEASAVGEVNVVAKMKDNKAIIGGEGNGGVIFPELHYGRDSLVGIALFLSHLAHKNMTCSQLRASYPNFFMSKNKVQLTEGSNPDEILNTIKAKLSQSDARTTTIDGLKLDFDAEKSWVHMRKSNTEPIIRIYTEATSQEKADELAQKYVDLIKNTAQ